MANSRMFTRVAITKRPYATWGVDLPTYDMVAGSWLPLVESKIDKDGVLAGVLDAEALSLEPTVLVEIPDDWKITVDGQLDAEQLREMYREHPRFGAKDFMPPRVE